MNDIFREDMEQVSESGFIEWEKFRGKTILITGATGLIGVNLVNALSYADKKFSLGLKILAVVRNLAKAQGLFAGLEDLSFVVSDVEALKNIDSPVDYIIHGASHTSSRYFVSNPAETIATALAGTANVLALARSKNVLGLVYLSSMEAYGHVETERLLTESDLGYIDPLKPRSSYPESKRMCEAMCSAYANEYGTPAKIVRLVMTFGPGIVEGDSRVCAEFLRCVVDGRDIVLKTEGGAKRCYLYTADAVSAVLTVLLQGEAGRAYNAGNPETYCSVREMAGLVANEVSGGRIGVKISLGQDVSMYYPAPGFLKLDVSAISGLGWRAVYGRREMYIRTRKYIEQ